MMHEWYVHPDHLSPTSTATFGRCPRRWMYRRMGLESKEPKAALLYGSAFHHAVGLAFHSRIAESIKAFAEVWDESLANDKRSLARATAMMMNFAQTHTPGKSLYSLIPPPRGVEVPDRTSEWEVPFAIDIGIPVPIVGRVDGVGRHRDTGELWAIEFKTSGQLGAQFLSQFALDPQILTYALALGSYSTERVQGTIVEGVLVAKTKVENLCLPVYVREHSLRDVIEWYARAWIDMELYRELDKPFPMNLSSCSPYSGFGMPGYTCEYQGLCLAGDAWPDMLGMYEHVEPRKFELIETPVSTKGAPNAGM